MILLTAGHHNKDSGAVSHHGREADYTKLVRDTIAFYLRREGVEFWKDNDNWTLYQTIKSAKRVVEKHPNSIAIDIHFNAFSNPSANGAECLVDANYTTRALDIATEITHLTSSILKIKSRGVKTEQSSYRKRLGYLDIAPESIIWEVGFITNDHDMNQFKDRYWLLAKGVSEYLIKCIN